MTTIRRAVITVGSSNYFALAQPRELLGGFDRPDPGDRASTDLNRYDLAVVARSTDNGSLQARRYRVPGVPAGFAINPGVAATAPEPPGRA